MAVLKLSKKDIIKNEDKEDKIKLKRSDLSYDSVELHGWEQSNKESLDILNKYNERVNNKEWLSSDDLASYRKALDSYLSTSNRLRGINKTFGERYTDEDEKTWQDSVASMNKGYDDITAFYSQFASDKDYSKWQKLEELNSVIGAEDFEANKGYVSTKMDSWWDKLWSQYSLGYNDLTYEYINNQNGLRDEINSKYRLFSQDNSFAEDESDFKQRGYDFLTDDEVGIYNYYYSTQGKDKAQEYIDSLETTLVQRKAGEEFKNLEGRTLAEIFYGVVAGAEQWRQGVENLGSMITGDEGFTPSSQYVSGMVREDLADNGFKILGNSVGQIGYDLLNTTSNMLPSILVGSVTGGFGGALTLGASATGNAYAEMRHLGYDRWQSTAYAGLVGASETALQYALGGISKLGGKVSGNAISKLVSKFDNAIARTAITLGGNMASEGLEEAIQTVLEPAFKALVTGEEFEAPEWEEVLYSGLLGALSAGMLEGVPTIAGTVGSSTDAKKLYGGSSVDLVNESLEIDPNNAHAQRMKARLDSGKDISGYQLNRLANANYSALRGQDISKIETAVEARLTELGEKGDVKQLSKVLAKQVAGEALTSSEKALLKNSTFGERVANELDPANIESGEYTSAWAEKIDTDKINAEAYSRMVQDLDTEQAPNVAASQSIPVTENTSHAENAVEGEFEASEESIPTIERDGKEVEAKIAKIASVEDGKMTVELDDGEVVDAGEVNFGTSVGLVYQAAKEMSQNVAGFNLDTANVFVKGFNPEGGISAGAYVEGFREAYRFGAQGYPSAELALGKHTSQITEEQRNKAYNLGKIFGNENVAKKQVNTAKTEGTSTKKKGRVYFDGKVAGKSLTERQRASLKGLQVVAEAMGIDIHVFESPVGKDGKRQGANGWYNPSDNTIHIDLHAGVKGEGLMLFTAAHELTHHIREVAPAKFKIFADALLEEYSKNGKSVSDLIEEKKAFLEKKGRLEGMTDEQAYDLAYEEVVADSAEAMLVDSNAFEELSRKINAKDKSLWQSIKDFIAKLVARIKAAYKGLNPDSAEANYVRDMVDSAERLQKLWVDALLEASEVSTETILGEQGIIVDTETDSASLYSVRDLLTHEDQKKVAKILAERFGVAQAEAMDWLKAETSLASLILNPKYSQYLDYTPDPDEEAIKSNSDYPQGTVDFSNICKKRRDFTEVMNRVLRNFPNHVFAATDLAKIRTIMEEEGMEVACAICYVEDRRQLDSVVAQDFIDSLAIYRNGGKTRPDGKAFNANQLKAFSLIEGDTYTPTIYELVSLAGRNSLKAKNPAMEEAWVKFNNARGMQSVRLLLNDAEYKRQILKYTPAVVKRKNDLGGLRIYSFSDAEMFHLIDIVQVITDSAAVGLSIQGYTKVNEYAKAVKDTGEKLNRSLIPKGDLGYHMENGKVVLDFDTVEGIDINHPDFFDNIDNPNIGNIVIGINATQIKAAMTSKFIDQIIPFHTGQSNEVLGEKGIAAWDNYKDFQSERDAKTNKKASHQINIYTEVINAAEAEGHPITNKVEFVNKFLEVCKENNLIPRFSDFLNVDENGNYVYTEGYHKFLVDFKTFDQNTGEYLPQKPVKPNFDNEYITSLLTDYVESQKTKDAAFAKAMPKVLERVTNEVVKSYGVKYSDRDSLGNELSKEQQEFFKDSKVRDAKGNLMVMYHGTTANFNTFKKGDVGFHFGTKGAARGRVGFGKNVTLKEVYLNITNPIVFDEDLGSWDADFRLTRELYDKGILTQAEAESVLFTDDRMYKRTTEAANKKLSSVLLEKGYDGIAYSNTFETKKATTSYIVFKSNQAKEITNKAPTSNSDIRYSDRSFASQVDAVLSGADTNNTHLKLMETPTLLQAAGLPNLPILMTANHLKTITSASVKGKSKYHGLDVEIVKKLPEYISDPVMIADSITRDDSVVIITEAIDSERRPVIAAILLNGTGAIDGRYINANIMTSAYGKDNFQSFLNKIADNNAVIYWNKEKSQDLSVNLGLQLPNIITSLDSNVIIRQAKAFVNTQSPNSVNSEFSEINQDRATDSFSNRSLLADALETAAQNDIEREKLKQYKQKIDLINAEQEKLQGLNEKIKELSFTKGPRDTDAIRSLQFEANQTANRINTYDRQLLTLESTKALKGVLEREKAQARKRAEQKAEHRRKADLAKAKERAAKTQRELMDRYQESRRKSVEGRNKTEMRHKIKGIVSELNTLLLKPTAKKHIKEELRKEVADALSAINLDTVDADARVAKYNALIARENDPDIIEELTKTRDNIQLQGDKLKEKLSNLQSAYEKIKNTDDIELNLAYQEVIQNSIKAVSEKVGDTPIRNMTLEQLEMVYDLFKMIRHTIRDANKAFKEQKGLTIMQMAEAVNDQVRTVGGQPYKHNAISAFLKRMGWTFLKPYVAFRTIGSVTLTNMYKELRNGEDTFYGDVKDAQAFIEEQYKKHGYKSWDLKKTKPFTAKSGKTFELTLEQRMSLYAYSQREQAHDHIIEGGIVFEDALIVEKNKLGIPVKYEVTTKDAFNLSEETFAEIATSLSDEQKAFVDEMQKYLSVTMGEKGNEVSMKLLGVKLFKEKFYLPIKSSQYYMNFKAEEAGEVKLKSPAFSKETIQHANNPIVIHNFTDLWAEHINDMSMYHSFVLALEDFTRVYNYKTKTDAKVETMDTKATLETAYPGVTKYINKFLKDMNGGVRGETVGWAEKLTSLAKKGAVLGSASVAIQQPSAIMRAMAYISPKYFVLTAHKSFNLAKHKQDFEELKKYAPIAGIKEMGRFDVGMGQGTVDWIQSNKTLMEKGEEILSKAPAFMDEVTWVSIWNAVKRETAHNNPKLKTSGDEFLNIAGERFTEIISLSQVYDSVFARSDIMRNKSWIAKSLTAFMAEPTTTLNMIWDSWVQAKRSGSVKGYAKAIATTGAPIVAATVLNAALKSIIVAMRDDDEDESYAEKYLEHFAGDLKDSLNPLGLIPFVKDIVSIFNGYDVERMDMALFSDLKKAIDAFDSDSKTEYEKWSGLIGAISAFFGVPVKNVERDVRALINTVFGKTEETTTAGMLNAITEGWTGKEISNAQQLYEAMIKGDSAQIKRAEGRFEDQKAIDAAIRKALRENDPRIKEAAEAYLEGDYATYNSLREEIIAEGIFSRQIVFDALKAEYNYLKKKEEDE